MIHPLKDVITARYENTNCIGIAIIAVITHDSPDHIFDWAAYIGASPDASHQQSAVLAARRWGNKLSLPDAQHYFPQLPLERYRE